MGTFDELLRRGASFVDKQKGRWDETAWANLVSEVRRKGVQVTSETESYFGSVLESLKRLYGSALSHNPNEGVTDVLHNVATQAAHFVQQSQGIWDHAAWERFLADVQNKGVSLTEDIVPAIGEVLEASKRFFHVVPSKSAQPAAKPRTRTVQASAAKAKAAAATTKARVPKAKASTAKAKPSGGTAAAAAKKTARSKSAPAKAKPAAPSRKATSGRVASKQAARKPAAAKSSKGGQAKTARTGSNGHRKTAAAASKKRTPARKRARA